LEQAAKLVLILYTRFGMYESTLIRYRAIASDEDIVRDRLSEDLNLENIGDDLLCLPIDVGVNKRNVVVACNDVPQGRQTLFYPLNGDGLREGVAKVLKLLIGGRGGNEQAMAITLQICQ
jgi:hypothetical protein